MDSRFFKGYNREQSLDLHFAKYPQVNILKIEGSRSNMVPNRVNIGYRK